MYADGTNTPPIALIKCDPGTFFDAAADACVACPMGSFAAGSEVRARNLGAIYSVRAGARIVTPLLSAWLFEISRRGVVRGGLIGGIVRGTSAGGALPYFLVSALTAALIPVPLVLKSFEGRKRRA